MCWETGIIAEDLLNRDSQDGEECGSKESDGACCELHLELCEAVIHGCWVMSQLFCAEQCRGHKPMQRWILENCEVNKAELIDEKYIDGDGNMLNSTSYISQFPTIPWCTKSFHGRKMHSVIFSTCIRAQGASSYKPQPAYNLCFTVCAGLFSLGMLRFSPKRRSLGSIGLPGCIPALRLGLAATHGRAEVEAQFPSWTRSSLGQPAYLMTFRPKGGHLVPTLAANRSPLARPIW